MTLVLRLRWTLLALLTAMPPRVLAQQGHVEAKAGWSNSPISNAILDRRIQDAATQYRAYAPVLRVAFYDIAYPKDSAEAVTLNGFAVMVVTALVQDSTELPLPQLYFRSDSGDQELAVYSALASLVADTVIRTTFGKFRSDGLYLLPLALRLRVGDLLADFAVHRKAFRLGHFDGDTPEQLQRLGSIETPTHLPPKSAIEAIVRREYPDLARVLLSAPE